MGEDARAGGAQVTDEDTTRDPQQIRRDIEYIREDLGDTVEALAQKTDLKTQTQRKIAEVRQTIDAKRDELVGKGRHATPDGAGSAAGTVQHKARENPVPVAIAGAFAAGLILGRITHR
jgi:phage host-nuclease inhibitor protein Gam